MTINKSQLYGLAAVLAAVAAVLQLLDRDWFRAASGAALALAMVLAATGFRKNPSPTSGSITRYSA